MNLRESGRLLAGKHFEKSCGARFIARYRKLVFFPCQRLASPPNAAAREHLVSKRPHTCLRAYRCDPANWFFKSILFSIVLESVSSAFFTFLFSHATIFLPRLKVFSGRSDRASGKENFRPKLEEIIIIKLHQILLTLRRPFRAKLARTDRCDDSARRSADREPREVDRRRGPRPRRRTTKAGTEIRQRIRRSEILVARRRYRSLDRRAPLDRRVLC